MTERQVFGDTETTGFDANVDRMVEYAFIECIGLKPTGRRLHGYVSPKYPVAPGALETHGLTDEFLKDKPVFSEHAGKINEFLEGAVFIAHNVDFDAKFIRAELGRCGMKPSWLRTEDTLAIARRKFPGEQVSLDALIRRFGVDGSKREKHGAMIDTELLIEVYEHLLGLRTLRLEASEATAGPLDLGEFMPARARQSWFPQRDVKWADEAEMATHAAFAGSLKGAKWIEIFAEEVGACTA